MNKPIKVSILVPIYNVEKYLRQCLDSLVNQTLSEIEIICLNDGSTDSSPSIIQEYAKQDSRIIVVNKPNSGYGDSMNQGLKKARGEYIGIVESDDWIDLDAFEKLYNIATLNKAEVVRANYYFNKGGKDQKNYYIPPADAGRIIDPAHHTWIFLQSPAIWSAIYERKFLEKNQIEFLPTPGASYQDTGFNFKVWASAHRAYFTTEAFLHYRIDNEASSVNNPGKVMNVCYEYEEIEKYLKQHQLLDDLYPTMVVAKYGAYLWNLERLISKHLPGFIQQTQADFKDIPNATAIIDRSEMHISQKKFFKYLLTHSPRRVALALKLRKFKKKLRAGLKKFWITTHPSYKKQQQLSELITELNGEIDLLSNKLQMLEGATDEETTR